MTVKRSMDEVFVETPATAKLAPRSVRMLWRALGTLLAPAYARVAEREGARGVEFHKRVSWLALKCLIGNRAPNARRELFNLVGNPIILTRYQEFDFAWRSLPAQIDQYLDISSPSLFPLRLMVEHSKTKGTMLNPDAGDLQLTRQLTKAAAVDSRCSFSSALITEIDSPKEAFDLITSLSVIEHIPENKPAIESIWQLLKPGGTLIVTVPCAARGYALYTNADHYGLLNTDDRGRVFLEYLYDESMLQTLIFNITGLPKEMEIYGETRAGFLRQELQRRWAGHYTQFWKEPVLMGREFKRFEGIADLPGEGVIGMTFVKGVSK